MMTDRSAVWEEKVLITPSLISVCDPCRLEESVRELERAGITALHVDILDGHFSPSMPLGLDAVRALRKRTDLAFDVHLMASENDYFLGELAEIGVDRVVFHAETERHIDRQLNFLHEHGIRAGVALKPATDLSVLDYILEKCDAVLLMLINPGFAQVKGEQQVSYAARKIRDLRGKIESRGLPTKVILDGRISLQNIRDFGPDGTADSFVAGGTCLDKTNLETSARELLELRAGLLKGGQHG